MFKMRAGMDNVSIVIVGVGGQGTLLASRILGAFGVNRGTNVKVSEVHGMAQRGGTVVTYIRLGDCAVSPLIEDGCADYILSFELMEAARALHYLKKGGTVITNTQCISPMSVVTGAAAYPEDLPARLKEKADTILVDAYALAEKAGETRAVNLVLLGALCALTQGDAAEWEKAISECVPARSIEVNLKAFELGTQVI